MKQLYIHIPSMNISRRLFRPSLIFLIYCICIFLTKDCYYNAFKSERKEARLEPRNEIVVSIYFENKSFWGKRFYDFGFYESMQTNLFYFLLMWKVDMMLKVNRLIIKYRLLLCLLTWQYIRRRSRRRWPSLWHWVLIWSGCNPLRATRKTTLSRTQSPPPQS